MAGLANARLVMLDWFVISAVIVPGAAVKFNWALTVFTTPLTEQRSGTAWLVQLAPGTGVVIHEKASVLPLPILVWPAGQVIGGAVQVTVR